jgi:hypothetical protein
MERLNHCYCVFASATEETLGTFEGDTPGTAIRVLVEAGREGYVRLQQLAYTDSLGWYVQKSMVIPGEMIRPLVSSLRKADCLIPRGTTPLNGSLKLVHPDDEPIIQVAEHKTA